MDSQTHASREAGRRCRPWRRELGLSDRTLQRRIIDDGATFRQLLLEARQELAARVTSTGRRWMSRKWHFLLGYEDSNFFLSSFPKRGKGTTTLPGEGIAPTI